MKNETPTKSLKDKFKELQEERDEEIRKKYATGKYTLESLADEYGLTRQRVHQIVNES